MSGRGIKSDPAIIDWGRRFEPLPLARASAIPQEVAIVNAAGSYTARYPQLPDGLRVERHLVIAHSVFQPRGVGADDARAPFTITRAVGE